MKNLKAISVASALTDYDASTGADIEALNNLSADEDNAACDLALADYAPATAVALADMDAKIDIIDNNVDDIQIGLEVHDSHFHNYDRWFGISGDQSVNDWAIEDGLAPFVATSGSNAYGSAIKVLGTADTPNQSGMTIFDPHEIFVTDMNTNTMYYLRLIFDLDGDGVANTAEGKGYYTTTPFIAPDTNVNRVGGVPVHIRSKRVTAGLRVWAKVKNALTAKTLNFYIGIHEYDA